MLDSTLDSYFYLIGIIEEKSKIYIRKSFIERREMTKEEEEYTMKMQKLLMEMCAKVEKYYP